jgi:hypothetical protein
VKTVWRVFVYLKRYPMLAIATLACAIVGTLMMIVPPAATKYILDDVINGHHPERLLPLLILVAFAMLFNEAWIIFACCSTTPSSKKSFSICAAICIRTFKLCHSAGSIIAPPAI